MLRTGSEGEKTELVYKKELLQSCYRVDTNLPCSAAATLCVASPMLQPNCHWMFFRNQCHSPLDLVREDVSILVVEGGTDLSE